MRTIVFNCTYYIIYRVASDSSSLITLNQQIYPDEPKFLAIMTLKKLYENRHLFSILGNLKPRLRKAIFKYGSDNENIDLPSELYSHLSEGN